MEEVHLPPMEMLKALFQQRVSIQYSKDTEDLSVCPVSGPFEGKCLIRIGMAQVLNAEVFVQNGDWTVQGELRNFAQKYAEDLKNFSPAKRYQKIKINEKKLTSLKNHEEMIIFKQNLYLLRSC